MNRGQLKTVVALFCALPYISTINGNEIHTVYVKPNDKKLVAIPITGPYTGDLDIRPEGGKLICSGIKIQDWNLWTSVEPKTPSLHKYRVLNAYSGQEFVSITGLVTTAGSGGGGKPPPFQVTVPEIDVDWVDYDDWSEENEEDTRIVYLANDVRKAFIVREPREKDDGMLPMPERLPDMELTWPQGVLVYTNNVLIASPMRIVSKEWTNKGNTWPIHLFASQDMSLESPPSGILAIRLERMPTKWDVNGEITFDEIKCTAVKIELKVQHPEDIGPTGSIAKYVMYPTTGSANNLFSTWPDEPIKVFVQVKPSDFINQMSSGFIKWTVDGFSIPDNTLVHEFSWDYTGVKCVTLSFPVLEETRKIYIDIPNVGYRTEAYALAQLVDITAAPVIVQTGVESLVHCNHHYAAGPLRDAIRHSLWNALSVLSPLVSADEIYHVTTGHEYDNCHTGHQQAFNSTMDLHNNEVGRTVSFPITTIVTVPRVAEVLEDMYETGLLWIWEDAGAAINSEANSEGILVKSNNIKIYPIQ